MKKDFYVLIIEDEKSLANDTKQMVTKNCPFITRIQIVQNGIEGLEEIKKEMPDFIFLNQNMPGITGLEMIERCYDLELKLPPIVIITGGIMTRMEEDRLRELGITYICMRPLNETQIRFILYYLEESYKTSIKIKEHDMIRIIEKQTDPLLKKIGRDRTPYQVRLIGYILKYLLENDLEYSKEKKEDIYNFFKKRDGLEEEIKNQIKNTIEEVIKEFYTGGNPIRELNYKINRDEINQEFFHKLKENVLSDIIAESN